MQTMLSFALLLLPAALAARPFLEAPDIDAALAFGDLANGTTLPDLSSVIALHDFQYIAQRYMNDTVYMMYTHGAGGEWSYRNNLEAFSRYRFRPRGLTDPSNITDTLATTILGRNVSAPFFISPCAWAGGAHADGELNLVRAAAGEGILYIASDVSSKPKGDIAAAHAAAGPASLLFQQTYLEGGDADVAAYMARAEEAGVAALVLTVDAAASGNRQRPWHHGVSERPRTEFKQITWERYAALRGMTDLPIVLKGVQSVETAVKAVEMGAAAIYLSNHGGRQLDFSPSPLEVALEIHRKAPWVFDQVEVYADSGVRYGTDVLKLLALGVRAVGMGRPFMYSNVFGVEGVKHAIQLMKRELAIDGGNLGLEALRDIDPTYVEWTPNNWYG